MEAQPTQPSLLDDGYELFRRAIVERDEHAWADIYARYRPLLIAWSRNCSASASIRDDHHDIADRALARAWSALSPARFAQFPSLSALLAYLRACVGAAAIDYVRSQNSFERVIQRIETDAQVGPEQAVPEQLVVERAERNELWQIASQLPENEQERTVLNETFVLNLPPRKIQARHPHLFASVSEVYSAKRNLLGRLQRSPELRRLREEMVSL